MLYEHFCIDCNANFNYPKHITEPHGEIREVCPYCNGDFVKAKECDICHKVITNDYIKTKDGQVICDECFLIYNILE